MNVPIPHLVLALVVVHRTVQRQWKSQQNLDLKGVCSGPVLRQDEGGECREQVDESEKDLQQSVCVVNNTTCTTGGQVRTDQTHPRSSHVSQTTHAQARLEKD